MKSALRQKMGGFDFIWSRRLKISSELSEDFIVQRTISLTLLGFKSLLQPSKNIFFVAHTQKIQLVRVGFFHLCRKAQHRLRGTRNIIWASAQHHCRLRHKWTMLRRFNKLQMMWAYAQRCCASRKRNCIRLYSTLIWSWLLIESII